MHRFCLVLLAGAHSLAAASSETLPLVRKGHAIVLENVFLNHDGPYRMVVDTGNSSSLLRPEVARRLRLTPRYVVERVTIAGSRPVPASLLDEVRTGSVSQHAVEVMIDSAPLHGVDGVLGQSWLIQHDYLIEYRERRLVLDPDSPPAGVRLGLRSLDGRPAVALEVDGRPLELVLDSGAEKLILFEPPAASPAFFAPGNEEKARVSLASGSPRLVRAARVPMAAGGGLLPLAGFRSAYVSNREGFVVLVR